MSTIQLDPFKSDEERFFWRMSRTLPDLVPELAGLQVMAVSYETFGLRIGDALYTPDFYVKLWDQKQQAIIALLVEVKGSKNQKGYENTRVRLVEAAALYPEFIFLEVIVNARQSRFESFEILTPRPFAYLSFLPR